MCPNSNHKCATQDQINSFLRSKGVVTLPPLVVSDEVDMMSEGEDDFPIEGPAIHAKMSVPGRKCPKCGAAGQTVWVIPGKSCPKCGTAVY